MSKFSLTIILTIFAGMLSAQTIKGTIKDAKSDEGIMGATIVLKEQPTKGSVSSVGGAFEIDNVQKFPTTIIVSFVGYKSVEVVVNNANENLQPIALVPDNFALDKIAVVGRRRTDNESSLVAGIHQAHSVTVGVSGAQIAKTSDSDAGEVVKRIPGISLIDNRFIIVRGLSQRYNNVWINNGGVPSSEADGRAFSFDIIPSANIENIVISKSYSAELPGDFCGGFIKITTKGMPDRSSFQVALGSSVNSQTHFGEMRLGSSSKTDWMGFDGTMRPLGSIVPENLGSVTDNLQMDKILKTGFNNDWSIKSFRPLPDIKISTLWNERINDKLGMILSFGYNNSNKTVNDIINKRYGVYNFVANTPTIEKDYHDNQYTNDVKLNLMNNWVWEKSSKSRIEFRNLVNLIGRNRLTERYGFSTVSGNYYENQTELLYSSRLTYTGQLAGNHTLGEDVSSTIDWNATYSYANREEPDRRIIKNIGSFPDDGIARPDIKSYNDQITRYYETINDNIGSAALNYKKIFRNRDFNPTLRTGLYAEYRNHTLTPREFLYRYDRLDYDVRNEYIYLPFEQMMDTKWIGSDKVYLDETTHKSNAYTGTYSVKAGYFTATVPLGHFDFDLGVRAEMWNMSISYDRSMSPTQKLITKYDYDKLSILPAVNIAYNFNSKNLVRASYGRTVNRPEFRELSPAIYYDFDLFAEMQGNPDLKMATIDNYDLRYEIYPASGEMISIGAFYKHFKNPIEWNFIDMGGSYRFSYQNAESAYTIGAEIDLRKSLNFIGIPQLSVVLNGAIIDSKVKFYEVSGSVKDKDRPLQGQSPYIVNAGLYYTAQKSGLSASLLYNVIGKRIMGIGKRSAIDGDNNYDIPDVYEMPNNMLDVTLGKRFGKRLDLRLGIKNILNQPIVFKQFPTATIAGVTEKREQITRSNYIGQTYLLALTVKF